MNTSGMTMLALLSVLVMNGHSQLLGHLRCDAYRDITYGTRCESELVYFDINFLAPTVAFNETYELCDYDGIPDSEIVVDLTNYESIVTDPSLFTFEYFLDSTELLYNKQLAVDILTVKDILNYVLR